MLPHDVETFRWNVSFMGISQEQTPHRGVSTSVSRSVNEAAGRRTKWNSIERQPLGVSYFGYDCVASQINLFYPEGPMTRFLFVFGILFPLSLAA